MKKKFFPMKIYFILYIIHFLLFFAYDLFIAGIMGGRVRIYITATVIIFIGMLLSNEKFKDWLLGFIVYILGIMIFPYGLYGKLLFSIIVFLKEAITYNDPSIFITAIPMQLLFIMQQFGIYMLIIHMTIWFITKFIKRKFFKKVVPQ
jgi:hypothetical protein